MNLHDAVQQRRSIRKFLPREIPYGTLRELIDLARLYPSGGNLQPLRFAIISDPAQREALFQDLGWAMYLPDFKISPEERPTAYIVLLRDAQVRKKCDYDVGAASTIVMLAAVAKGLASCPLGNFHSQRLSALLCLDEHLVPELVIALGYPAQESHAVPMAESVRYTQTPEGNILVPKWNTDDILVAAPKNL